MVPVQHTVRTCGVAVSVRGMRCMLNSLCGVGFDPGATQFGLANERKHGKSFVGNMRQGNVR